MLIDTLKLEGKALDYAVALAEGGTDFWFDTISTCFITIRGKKMALSTGWASTMCFCPSEMADLAYLIIEREGICVIKLEDEDIPDEKGYWTGEKAKVWGAAVGPAYLDTSIYGPQGDHYGSFYTLCPDETVKGATPLIAAMRCWVLKKLGKQVEIPQMLLSDEYNKRHSGMGNKK